MTRLRIPFSAAKVQQRNRWLTVTYLLSGPVYGLCFYIITLYGLGSFRFAEPVAVCASIVGVTWWICAAYLTQAWYRERLVLHLMIGCLFGSVCGIIAFTANVSLHLPDPAVATLTAGVTIASAAYSVRETRRTSKLSLAWRARGPIRRAAAEKAYAASQDAVGNRRNSVEEQKTSRLSRALAASARSIRGDAPDGLVEAADELHELLADPPQDWSAVMQAALALVQASQLKADKHGDLSGHEEALRMLKVIADRMPADLGAMAFVYQKRAEYHFTLASRLPPGPEAEAHGAEAIASWRSAISAVSPHLRRLLPMFHADLGAAIAFFSADPERIDLGIAECRIAIRHAGQSPWARAYPQRSLAGLLMLRAAERIPDMTGDAPGWQADDLNAGARADLAEARLLLRLAHSFGSADERVYTKKSLAELNMMRATIFGRNDADKRAIRAWRRAAGAAVADDPLQQVRTGQGWVTWAERTENVARCAEAYDYLMKAVPRAVAVRYLPGERDRLLADLQAIAEEAGYWLAMADRVGDAAIALETGRAVSLTEILGRDRPGLDLALRQAGRPDLAERFRAAVESYGAATRLGRPDSSQHHNAPQRVWSSYEAVVREAAAVVGIDLPGTPPTLADLKEAAREGPLIYLAAASRSGYAIIVPASGSPAFVPLPSLTRTEVENSLDDFLQAADPERVASMIRWLWVAGLRELAQQLPTGALITIIPVGLLSLLPVHAAGGPPVPGQEEELDDWAFLADKVTVRYAHNARTLLASRTRVTRFPSQELSLLAVAAPNANLAQPLRHAAREVTQISELWRRQGARSAAIPDGAYAATEQALAECHTVWHFACHCQVQPDRVLDSTLQLKDGELSLRAVLAMSPAPRRLAILSACETHRSGSDLPDEAMGLPAGLLHAGFAGVIASHWPAKDYSTAYLMTRFHDLWLNHGLHPAAALAQAQRWLRTATPTDLYAYDRLILHGGSMPPANSGNEPHGEREHQVFRHPFYWALFALTGH